VRFSLKPAFLIRREAAQWMVRLDRDPSPANVERFRGWRNKDPRNAAEADKARAILSQTGLLRRSPIADADRLGGARARRSHPPDLALAASIGAALLALAAIHAFFGIGTRAGIEAVMLTSGVGEIRTVELADGSRLTLDTQSAVRVDIGKGRRRAILERGRARFQIAKADAPFELSLKGETLKVREAVVDLSSLPEAPAIALIAGTAEIVRDEEGSSNAAMLRAPARLGPGTAQAPHEPGGKGAPAADWTAGKLGFADARLADVISAANRYTERKIVAGDPAVESLRVTGTFKTGDAGLLANALAGAFGLRAVTYPSGNIILERPKAGRGAADFPSK
jgi:transmembrane sensor